MEQAPQFTNRLIGSTSPYLLQHAHNPVDWHPWSEEALALSRSQDRPIFLSIGYSACHWCHVMERESFENEAIADFLREHFVAIKVDREERPDLDEIYMTATQLMTHSGGWPMTVFLTPDLKPFYAGTYFPPEDKWGRPGFLTLLREIARAWRDRRQELEGQAERVCEAIANITGGSEGMGAVKPDLIGSALKQIAQGFDPKWGGFGGAPKFPPSMRLELLLRNLGEPEDAHRRTMLDHTLTMMARGGMYDQVGGGFARYSVDEQWLVPHFEKMLYDNGLLARVYVLAYERTGNWYYRRVAQEILDYILLEMTDPDGGFYSATDADSEGEEGKFFVWSPGEIREVLGDEDGARFCEIYDIAPGGNFEGHSIANLLAKGLDEWASEAGLEPETFDAELAPMRRKLWEHREGRIHPLRDDKVLASWNGLMIRAFAEGYRVFGEERYRAAAEKASDFILTRMRAQHEDGQPRLLRSYRAGTAALNAYQEDYSYLALALLDLHHATGEERWKTAGVALLDQMEALFWDHESGGFYFTSHDHEVLITRTRSMQDGATPSGSSVAVQALVRAARLTGDERYSKRAAQVLSSVAPQMAQMSAAFPNMLVAADEYLETWPDGIRIPGADLVEFAGELEPQEVAPGGSFWIRARLTISEGHHVGSAGVRQAQFSPTELQIEVPKGFTAGEGDIPVGTAMPVAGEEKPQWIYTGEVTLGQEIRVGAEVQPGRYPLIATLRVQPCDDQQCYPALEARLPLEITISD